MNSISNHTPTALDYWLEAWRFDINESNFPVRLRQLRARSNAHLSMNFSQMGAVLLVTFLMSGHVAPVLLWGWLAWIICAHSFEIWVWRHYDGRNIQTIKQCREWDVRFRWLTLLGGLSWGAGASLIWFVPNDLAYQALLLCIIFPMVAGAVTTNPVFPPSLIIYVPALLLPLMMRQLFEGDATHLVLLGVMFLYIAYVTQAGFGLMRTYETSLVQRFEKEDLLQALREREKQIAEALKTAELANQTKSKFLATASHDLRQPLQALRLFSEALLDTAKEPEPLRLAGQIGKSVNALVEMFDDLLDVSRLEAGIIQPRWQHFELGDLFDRLLVDFTPLSHAKGLQFELNCCSGNSCSMSQCNVVIYSDPFLLERMLRNLISNAIRYTDSGKVWVQCICAEKEVEIAVRDTGIGIRPEVIHQIFEEYYQVDNPHRDRRKGLGLGLAIVRRVEELLGYQVKVESAPGRGTQFSFRILKGDATAMVRPFAITLGRQNVANKVIALVEDDKDIREFTAEIMQDWGCQVFAAATGAEVLRELDKAALRPDMLVCDYRLPNNQTAIDVMREMREFWGDLPALVITGDTGADTLQLIQKSGATLLHKPIAAARLRTAMFLAMHGNQGSPT